MTTLAGITTYAYDAVGQLSSVMLPDGKLIMYGYDAMGNRTTVTQDGVTSLYTTNDLNQYTAVGGALYTYDADGNLRLTTGPDGTTTYTFNVQNQLVNIQSATDTWAYTYDALGNLIATVHNGQTTRYLVDPSGIGSVLGEYDLAGNVVANYTAGLGLTSRVDATGNTSYYDFDAQGSTADLTGLAGTPVDFYSYLPFGEVTGSSGPDPNPFQYVGQAGVMTEGNGLDSMRARDYLPSLGRFVSEDPSGIGGGTNLYVYTGNNPVTRIDPSGLLYLDINGGAAFGIGLTFGLQVSDDGLYPYIGPQLGTPGFSFNVTGGVIGSPSEGWNWGLGGTYFISGQVGSLVSDSWKTLKDNFFVEVGAGVFPGAALSFFKVWRIDVHKSAGNFIDSLLKPLSFFNPSPKSIASVVATTTVRGARDPNYILGLPGYAPSGFVQPTSSLPYTIGFENEASANAPAQVVAVTQQLDPNLDWSTFQLGSFGFGGQEFAVPAGRTSYSTRIDARSTVGV